MTDLTNVSDYANIGPGEFAKLVKNTPDAQLAALLEGEHRSTILDSIFERMPELFRADKAGDTRAVITWIITGGPHGSDTYEVRIANGTCETSNKPTTDAPRLAVTVAPIDFVK